eukprot:4178793-Pyramimonas_sp.AAC.1
MDEVLRDLAPRVEPGSPEGGARRAGVVGGDEGQAGAAAEWVPKAGSCPWPGRSGSRSRSPPGSSPP